MKIDAIFVTGYIMTLKLVATMAEDKKKVWRRETCRKRYIEGKEISIRELAEASGRTIGTLGKWASQENWKKKREHYLSELNELTYTKAAEKASNKLSDELSDISIANYNAHKEMRDYVVEIIRKRKEHLEEIRHLNYAEWSREIKTKHTISELSHLSNTLTRATEGISAAIGLPYHVNVNTAYKKLEAEGYLVINPSADGDDNDSDVLTVDVETVAVEPSAAD